MAFTSCFKEKVYKCDVSLKDLVKEASQPDDKPYSSRDIQSFTNFEIVSDFTAKQDVMTKYTLVDTTKAEFFERSLVYSENTHKDLRENGSINLKDLEGNFNGLDKNEVFHASFSKFPFNYKSNKEISIFPCRNTTYFNSMLDGDYSTEEEDFPFFEFIKLRSRGGRQSFIRPNIACQPILSSMESPLVTLIPAKSSELHRRLYQTMKTIVQVDSTSNKSLMESFSILDNWSKRILRNAIDRSENGFYENVIIHFEKDLQFGIDVMKQMSNLVYKLMRATIKLPDPEDIQLHGHRRNCNRGDFINSGLKLCHTLEDLELRITENYKILKLIVFDVLVASIDVTSYIELKVNPSNLIISLYILVTQSLTLLQTEIDDYRNKIGIFFSEMDNLL